MKEHEQWEAYIDGENTCCVHKVTEMCGLPEDHYDYEEPMFLPANSIRVIVQDPTNDT